MKSLIRVKKFSVVWM